MNELLQRLAALVQARNEADRQIAALIGRPATPGNIGEFVAATIFGIRLAASGSQAGYDGVFETGPVAGKRVNVKAYGRHEGLLDVSPHPCDYYLVLAGPPGSARHRPWTIQPVFLFDTRTLLMALKERGVKISIATSVRRDQWEAARIYPTHERAPLRLTGEQQELLELFAAPRPNQPMGP
jgi:hypothetical protein